MLLAHTENVFQIPEMATLTLTEKPKVNRVSFQWKADVNENIMQWLTKHLCNPSNVRGRNWGELAAQRRRECVEEQSCTSCGVLGSPLSEQ